MREKLCFNVFVIEKKDVVVGMKVGETVKRTLDKIAEDTGGKTISTPFASLNNEYRKPIVPDSVGETVWRTLCRD